MPDDETDINDEGCCIGRMSIGVVVDDLTTIMNEKYLPNNRVWTTRHKCMPLLYHEFVCEQFSQCVVAAEPQ